MDTDHIPFIQPLTGLPKSRCGGKGYNLARTAELPLISKYIISASCVPTEIHQYYSRQVAHTLERWEAENVPLSLLEDADLEDVLPGVLGRLRECVLSLELSAEHCADITAFLTSQQQLQKEQQQLQRANSTTAAALIDTSDGELLPPLRWAVRSSCVSEDGAAASFAGQFDSKLNVEHSLISIANAIKAVWASQYSEHLLHYLRSRDSETTEVACGVVLAGIALPGLAVVLQRQVNSEASGVAFAVDPTGMMPVHPGAAPFVLEAVWGLGEGLVSGELSPETVHVDKSHPSLAVISRRRVPQTRKYICSDVGGIRLVPTKAEEAATGPITNEIVSALHVALSELSSHYGCPQDIEWCYSGGRVFIVQTRPVTKFTFAPSMPVLKLVLANRSHTLDETLVGDAYRQFLLKRFLCPDYTPQLHVLRIASPSPHGPTDVFLHRIQRIDDIPTAASTDPFAVDCAISGARMWRFDTDDIGFCGTGLEPSRCKLQVVPVAKFADLDVIKLCDSHSCLLIIVATVGLVSVRQVKPYVSKHAGPVFLLVEDGDGRTMSRMRTLADSSSITLHSSITTCCLGRCYVAADMQTRAILASWVVEDVESLHMDMVQAHSQFKDEYLPELEIIYGRLVRRTAGVQVTPFDTPITEGDILRFAKLYRDSCERSWSIGFHASTCESTYELALERIMEDIEDEMDPQHLLTGLTSNNALENLKTFSYRYRDSWDTLLGDSSRESPEAFTKSTLRLLHDYFRHKETCTPAQQELAEELYQYLAHYAWMADSDEDFATTHWGEDPSFPLTILYELSQTRAQVTYHVAAVDRPLLRRASSVASDELYEKACEKLGLLIEPDHPFWVALREMRTALRMKEQVHVQYVRHGLALKLAISEHLRAREATSNLAALDDFFHVPFAFWLQYLHGELTLDDLRAVAFTYSREYGMWRTTPSPQKLPASVESSAGREPSAPQRPCKLTLSGLGCSAGSGPVMGPARVVRSLADAKRVRKGDILVTSITSPAWSPLFSLLSGLVLEEGGMLSHGAVVARECGIPAVSQISDAITTIFDGQLLSIDGASGTVSAYEEIVEG